MFGLQTYLAKLYEIKWMFVNEYAQKYFEEVASVDFRQVGEHYFINNIKYTYLDILHTLEDCDFRISKNDNDIIIEIINVK